LPYQAQLL